MNLRGSYKALRDNSKSAMCASIEIYNKPNFNYRIETFIVLLMNSWELLFKAILSKNKRSIYYKKERNQTYKTLSLVDAMKKCRELFPDDIPFEAVSRNINVLKIYRDNVIHFYNMKNFEFVIYTLSQTAIINYRDVLKHFFNLDIVDEVTINLLPLSFKMPMDPIQYLKKESESPIKNPAVAQFIKEISDSVSYLETSNIDVGRMVTIWNIKLESVRKISGADFVVGVTGDSDLSNPLVIENKLDPNVSYPLISSNIYSSKRNTGKIDELFGIKFTSYAFQTIVNKFKIKENRRYCWKDKHTGNFRYSNEIMSFIKNLSEDDINNAIAEYRKH